MTFPAKSFSKKFLARAAFAAFGAFATAGTARAADETAPAPAASPADWALSAPVVLARSASGNAYANLSLVADFAAGGSTARDAGTVQMGGHDPAQRGFTVQGVELTLDGAVDPYLRATANVVFGLNTAGESFLELEECYAETVALPAGLQLRAGQFFTEFGRINAQHPHGWDFVDAPLVTARFLGPDGLRNPGARLSWLAPTPFYSELFLTAQNSAGETAHSFRGTAGESEHEHGTGGAEGAMEPFGRPLVETRVRGAGDLLYSARYAASFDFGANSEHTLLAGVSGAWAPNGTGGGARTQLYGADIFWKWKPASHHKGFPFVSAQAEVLLRRYTAAGAVLEHDDEGDADDHAAGAGEEEHGHVLPRESLWDWGVYAQANYGFRTGWVASVRADYAAPVKSGLADYERELHGARDPSRVARWRVSPALTWFPTEFARVRLQYNYDRCCGGTAAHSAAGFREAHSVWLQIEFLLGSHAAHKF